MLAQVPERCMAYLNREGGAVMIFCERHRDVSVQIAKENLRALIDTLRGESGPYTRTGELVYKMSNLVGAELHILDGATIKLVLSAALCRDRPLNYRIDQEMVAGVLAALDPAVREIAGEAQ